MKKDTVISLFDQTGNMVKPWLDAGYNCVIVDIEHPKAYATNRVTQEGKLFKVHADLSQPWLPPFSLDRIAFVAAFPPCDHLAVSGSTWFKGKGLRLLQQSIGLFATAAEFCEWAKAPYMIENPISTISTYWRKPDYKFHPWHFTELEPADNYTKNTCLWVGNGFQMPLPEIDENLGDPDDRILKCPGGPNQHNIRSATPMGFAQAIFNANHAGAI